jgi:HD-GYP domain-containing protein (c-di-GMP phosphodiesterase class II)
MGEDVGEWVGHIGGAGPFEALEMLVRNVGRTQPSPARVTKILKALAQLPALAANSRLHCEVGQMLAPRLGLGPAVVRGLGQVFERWNGSGAPARLRGEAIDRAVRLAQVATDAEAAHHICGADEAIAMISRRSGAGYDPVFADLFCRNSRALFEVWNVPSLAEAVLAAEPGAPVYLAGEQLETAIRAMGEYGDMKSRFTRGHSAGVAALATSAAEKVGIPANERRALGRAGHLHDIGRTGIVLRIWEKPGPLTESEWERVRLHTYYTERILARLDSLGPVASYAAMAHERLDSDGYHRRLPATAVPLPARILAAADAYQAMTEARPHRAALSPDRAAEELRKDAAAGRLDRDAVGAVLAAAGHAGPPVAAPQPAGLSPREIEVLRLLARGLTNKEIAARLAISSKTAGNHVQHIFEKIAVTTRAAAGLFAMQNDLLPPT